jgi:hypothetical protein
LFVFLSGKISPDSNYESEPAGAEDGSNNPAEEAFKQAQAMLTQATHGMKSPPVGYHAQPVCTPWGFSCGDSAVGIQLWGFNCGDSAVGIQLWGFSCPRLQKGAF